MRRHLAQGIAALAALLMLSCTAMAGKSMELRSANTYFNQGELGQALEWYEKAAAKDSKEGQVYARLVELYAEQKRWKEMSAAYARLDGCQDKPGDLKRYREEATQVIDQLWMGLWNGSIEQTKFADSLLAVPDKIPTAQDSAAIREHLEQARARIRTALDILPGRQDFVKRIGDLYINEFNALAPTAAGFPLLRQAAVSYGELAAAHPDSVDYAVTLVQLLYNSRQYDEARVAVDRALERHAANGDLLNYAGKVRIQQGLAMKDAKGGTSPEGKRLMGEATGYLDKAISLNPDDDMLVYNLALLYRDMGEPHKALATFARIEENIKPREGQALDPIEASLLFDSYYSMAVLYFQDLPEAEQDVKKAAEYFEKCLLLQPDNKGLKFNLGVSLIRTGGKANIERGKVLMEEGK